MGELIRSIQDFFDLVVDFITNLVHGIVTLVECLQFVFNGVSNSVLIFPSVIGTLIVTSLTLIIVLRVVGR